MERAVVALFDRPEIAYEAVKDLTSRGFDRKQISMMLNDRSGEYTQYIPSDPGAPIHDPVTPGAIGVGAGAGAVMGGITGLLVGLGALVLPGIGPIVAAGPLTAALSALTGAGVGAASGSLVGGVAGILADLGLSEEQAGIYEEGLRRGGVLVVVRALEEKAAEAEHVLAEHHPIDVDQQARVWMEGGWKSSDLNPTPEPESMPGGTPETSQSPHDLAEKRKTEGEYLDKVFRNYYHNSRNSLKYQLNEMKPAYEYGRLLRTDPRFWKLSWEEIEPLVKEDWAEKNPTYDWEEVRDSVRYMWEGNFDD